MTDENRLRLVARRDRFSAVATWGARAEPAEALAARWLAFVARLQAIDPAFAHWMHWAEDDVTRIPFAPTLPAQLARVLAATPRHVTGRLVPTAGVQMTNHTDTDQLSRYVTVFMSGGNSGPHSLRNCVSIGTSDFAAPEPHLVTFAVFRQLVLALAEEFEARQAYACPADLRDLWPEGRADDLSLAWISYVPRASLIW